MLIFNLPPLSFSLPLVFFKNKQNNRTVVSKQAEFEKAVFAKTARVNARGDGKRKKKRRREKDESGTMVSPLLSSTSTSPADQTTAPLS